VVLTTPRVMHLRKSCDTIDLLGLITMFTFVHLHWTKIVTFSPNAIAQSFPLSGWRSALKNGKDSYHTSQLTVVGLKSNFPHARSRPFIHPSSSSDDDESSTEDNKDTQVPGSKRAHPSDQSPGSTSTTRTKLK
jgi:hypothetical protein